MKRHAFRGKAYKILWKKKLPEDDHGICDNPYQKYPRYIKIKRGQNALFELDTLIHESTHACLWDFRHVLTDAYSTQVARELLQLGYKREGVKIDRKRINLIDPIKFILIKHLARWAFQVDDTSITNTAEEIAWFLVRLGYRKQLEK